MKTRTGGGGSSSAKGRKRSLSVAFIGGRGVGSAYSGIERYYEEMGSRLAARGHRVLVYCRGHFSQIGKSYRGMEVRRIPTIRSKHLETFVHSLLSTLDVCFRNVDIVQFHALGSSPFALLPRIFGKRTIVSVRGLDWQRAKWGLLARTYLQMSESAAVHCPNVTVVVSKVLQEHFQARHGKRVFFIPNGVARPAACESKLIGKWGLEERKYILYAGRLSPEKNLDVLIKAHQAFGKGSRLVIAGGSSYSDGYIAKLKALSGPEVLFTGFLTGPVLQELYEKALAFVLPSEMEGLSVALLEAMAYGLPVVASDIPENRELVDGCGGYLFRLGDVASLGKILEVLINDPQVAQSVGAETAERVKAQFSWEAIAGETENLYWDLLSDSLSR